MGSHGARNWVDIANAARELVDAWETVAGVDGPSWTIGADLATDRAQTSGDVAARRLRTLLGTVDDTPPATHLTGGYTSSSVPVLSDGATPATPAPPATPDLLADLEASLAHRGATPDPSGGCGGRDLP